MPAFRHPFHIVLLGLCLLYLVVFAGQQWDRTSGIEGYLYPDGTPAGGDFINLWAAAKLALEGRFAEVYDPAAFMSFQAGLAGAPTGLRLWVYPSHSLLLIWPFGLMDYYPALLVWSALGLAVLAAGCRSLGLGRLETVIVLVSPASVLCLHHGQTGNLMTGLLLLALARTGNPRSVAAGAFLTVKPQFGLLLPLFWMLERRWATVFSTAGIVAAGLVATFVVTGPAAWQAYAAETLPLLSLLAREGTGPFMTMVPSMFMSARILTEDGDLALAIHFVVAGVVVVALAWRLWREQDWMRRVTLILLGTAVLTPYLHNYDLGVVVVGALLVLRRFPPGRRGELGAATLVALAPALPVVVALFYAIGVPASPLIMLGLLVLA